MALVYHRACPKGEDIDPTKSAPRPPDWSVQGKLNDYAKDNPQLSTDEVANAVKDEVGYDASDDWVYKEFYKYHQPAKK